jgi:nucleoid DNA-binding protein
MMVILALCGGSVLSKVKNLKHTHRSFGTPLFRGAKRRKSRSTLLGVSSTENALHERNLNYMRASIRGRDELAVRVQTALSLATKKEAEHIVNAVIRGLETTLLNNLGTDGFTLKLNGFGKFSIRHRPGIRRKIGFTGETILTKDRRKVRFISLGVLRQRERVTD